MNTMKYLLAGALMVVSGSAMAQSFDEAVNAIKSGKSAKEVESLVKDVKDWKKNAVGLAQVGRAYLDVKDTLNTRKYANLSVEAEKKLKEGKSAVGYILLGDLEVYNDNPGDAAAWYQNAIYFNPKAAEAYKKYAFIYRGRDPKQAVQTLEKLREVDPSYPVDAEAGHIYYMSATKSHEYMPLALQAYQKVQLADLAKLEPYYMTEYALVAFASQKNDLSKQIAEFGLKATPRNAGYNRLAMYNSVELKQFEDAVKYTNKLFNESDTANFTAMDYKYAALAYTGINDLDNAIANYKKQVEASTSDTQKAAALKDLSDSYKAKGDLANSLATYEEYLKLNPKASANDYAGFANIYRNMAAEQTGAAQKESVDKALAIYKDMIEKFPTSADYCNFMAARTSSIVDPDQKLGLARPYYDALFCSLCAAGVKDNSDKARLVEACQYLGIYFFKIQNDNATAKPYFEKLQEIDPENALAKQVLEIIK